MQPIAWRIFYGNGDVWSSRDSSWEGAPSENVQVVVVYLDEDYLAWRNREYVREPYCAWYQADDYYWRDPQTGTFGCGLAPDVPDALRRLPGVVKLGRALPEEQYWAIYNRARDARALP